MWTVVNSGVPQGSVLGPILFNFFINDISCFLNCKSAIFADDSLIYNAINSPRDSLTLQADLDRLCLWSQANRMPFNTSKTNVLHITRSRNKQLFSYSMFGCDISPVSSIKYLGVTLNSKLTFDNHVNTVVTKAKRMLGFIWSVAGHASTDAFISLYKSLVLPGMEYAQPAWFPWTKTLSDQLESVHRTASRLALKQRRGHMGFEERLRSLSLSSLAVRRDKFLIIFCFKVLVVIMNCSTILNCLNINLRHKDRLCFVHQKSRTQAFFHSAAIRLPRVWEKLPSTLVDAAVLESPSSFIRKVHLHFDSLIL